MSVAPGPGEPEIPLSIQGTSAPEIMYKQTVHYTFSHRLFPSVFILAFPVFVFSRRPDI